MKILKMTATFGKLENKVLTLVPGLNIIEAPNEWGKSTWCAFLTAMLYGISTKERTTKDSLAVKDRYAPWSGVPMSGTMELEWNGKSITIQRSQQGRTPFGAFSAFETETGLPVSELTAANCGKVLLGIEKEVFERTAFLRLADLPVTDDGALRDRLNALVTTGDESGTDTMLTEKLHKLRNACKHNKTGLLPTAERERDEILTKIRKMDTLQAQQETLMETQKTLTEELTCLQNHKVHLAYEAAKEEETHLHNAAAQTEQLRQAVAELEEKCASLPPEEETRYKLSTLSSLQQSRAVLQEKALPQPPTAPAPHIAFVGLGSEEAVRKARQDQKAFEMLQKPTTLLFLILSLVMYAIGFALMLVDPLLILPCAAIGSTLLYMNNRNKQAQKKERADLCRPYGDLSPDAWLTEAESYRQAQQTYEKDTAAYNAEVLALEKEKAQLSVRLSELTLGISIPEALDTWQNQLALRDILSQKKATLSQAENHEKALRAVIKPLPAPETEDSLTLSLSETENAISRRENALISAKNQLQQLTGQTLSLGDKDALMRSLSAIEQRLLQLNDCYTALTVALETAASASQSLQRRFAPGISQKAQALFARLTGGRYDRLLLNRDFSMQVAAREETVLQDTRFRSDGTVDQLYLALRLAVADTLCPDAPLVLDDALVQFDDVRLKEALALLKEESENKQVILFTCQSREQLQL